MQSFAVLSKGIVDGRLCPWYAQLTMSTSGLYIVEQNFVSISAVMLVVFYAA